MNHLRGWGLLLAIGMPLLILFSWNRLGAETTRINVERYGEWSSQDQGRFVQPLVAHFQRHQRVARPGDVELAPFPKTSGVKRWSIQPDTVLHVELDAKDEGKPVVLRYVPMVKGPKGVFYDCVSAAPLRLVSRFCRATDIGSEAAIPAQLATNDRLVAQFAAGDAAAGTPPPALSGRVLAMPADSAALEACGSGCVRPQACVNPRPLACSRRVTEAGTTRLEITASPADLSGSSVPTLAEADAICERATGAGARVLRASSISGVARLRAGDEHWVHDDLEPTANCWSAAAR